MRRKRGRWIGAWFDLARSGARAAELLSRVGGRASASRGKALRKAATHLASGVVTPSAPAPATAKVRGGGRWVEGRWGLGPLAMRHYRLYLPPGASLRRPLPLLMLLHGCGQDAASFATATGVAAVARAAGFAALLPEQAREANPQRCWNWFRGEAVLRTEEAMLMAIVDHVCNLHPLRRDRLFVLGLSAGGAMAASLALAYPGRIAAAGSHSGAAPCAAGNSTEGLQAMRGRRAPDLARARRQLAGKLPPPLILIHGEADRSVAPANAEATAQLWRELAAAQRLKVSAPRTTRSGRRHPATVADWGCAGRPYLRLVRIAGLGHAWSGGNRQQAFSDPQGPDALRLAWRFFQRCVD